jgi:large subunit ribosomal protein L25
MENIISFQAETRQVSKKNNKALRHTDKVPAVIYGGQEKPLPVAVNVGDVKSILKSESGENSILRIAHDKHQIDAMIKELQYDYLADRIMHVDFIRIDLSKPIEVQVPVILVGEPIGVKLEDGLLDFNTREVTVRCLPVLIPKEIRLDISDLHTGHGLKVENLPLAEGVECLSLPHTVICSVVAKGKEEEVEAAAVVAPEATEAAAAPAEGQPAADKKSAEKKPEKKKEE